MDTWYKDPEIIYSGINSHDPIIINLINMLKGHQFVCDVKVKAYKVSIKRFTRTSPRVPWNSFIENSYCICCHITISDSKWLMDTMSKQITLPDIINHIVSTQVSFMGGNVIKKIGNPKIKHLP